MPITVDPVASDAALPRRADVVVIGGGIIGASTAYFLAEQGLKPLLCEKGVVAGEQSGRNWGWCRTMGRDPRELPLAIESLRLWRGLNERIGAETGFRQIGTFYVCPDAASFAKREAWLPHAKEHGLECHLLRGQEVQRLFPGAATARSWTGGLHTPSDGVAEPRMAAPAIANAARRLGAGVVTGCAVRAIERSAGRVSHVVTERGEVACDAVVLAGGAWSGQMCRSLDLRLPQLKVLATVFRTSPCPDGPDVAAWGPGLSLRRRLDGGYTVSEGQVIAEIVPDSFRFFRDFLPALRMEWKGISLRLNGAFFRELGNRGAHSPDSVSPYERSRILDPQPWQRSIDAAFKGLVETFPAFRSTRIEESWAGLIDATPDILPVISGVE
ncbi:MAG: NAD(P)/FAD-dependent oxidoreductase, partial [Parvibaculaceae bacterium]